MAGLIRALFFTLIFGLAVLNVANATAATSQTSPSSGDGTKVIAGSGGHVNRTTQVTDGSATDTVIAESFSITDSQTGKSLLCVTNTNGTYTCIPK
jgi:hypothetical protein